MSVAVKAYSTIDTVLKAGSAANSVAKLCKIKSYPDLGAAPDNLETMGSAGAQGTFTWTGQHDVYVNGGDVNAVREMTIVVTPSSAIAFSASGATT